MKTISTKEMYMEEIKDKLAVVLFSANWCPDCTVIEPILPEIEANFPQFTFYYANRDELIDLCSELDIFGIPSFIVYLNGEEVHRFVSKDRKTKEEIEAFLNEALEKIK